MPPTFKVRNRPIQNMQFAGAYNVMLASTACMILCGNAAFSHLTYHNMHKDHLLTTLLLCQAV